MLKCSLFHLLTWCALMTLTATDIRAEDPAAKSVSADSKSPPVPASAESAVEQHFGMSLQELEKAYEGRTPPESVRMLLAVVHGSMMGPGEGWFGPAESRFSWEWLVRNTGEKSRAIPADKFPGPAHWFARLDRNKDGRISADDLDWSDRNPWIQQSYLVNRLFRRIESNGDGKLTREEWIAFFDKAAAGKDHLLIRRPARRLALGAFRDRPCRAMGLRRRR